MDRSPDDGSGSPRIDVRSLPDSVAKLWETMLRLDPSWDLSEWLDECATDELELVEGHLGRQREVVERSTWTDPNQRNLFDVYEKDGPDAVSEGEADEGEAAVDFGSLDAGDDPLLAIVAEHVLSVIEEALEEGTNQVPFDRLVDQLDAASIRADEVDEAIAWLLQRRVISALDQDCFGLAL